MKIGHTGILMHSTAPITQCNALSHGTPHTTKIVRKGTCGVAHGVFAIHEVCLPLKNTGKEWCAKA